MATNDNEALDNALSRLQGIWSSPVPIFRFELEIRRLEKVISQYRRQEPIRAFYLLGLAATLREDKEDMRRFFFNSLTHSCNDPDVRHGYAACLSRMGFYQDARKQYEIIYLQDPQDLGVLAELIISSLASGRIQEGVKWIAQWSMLNPNRPFKEADTITKNGALLEKFGISDDQVEHLQSLAMKILDKECKQVKTINYRGIPEMAPERIDASLIVDDSPEEVKRLNGKLNRMLATAPTPRKVADVLVFNFVTEDASSL
ncbi:MAG: hypothetical protein HQL71_12275 [Magnetococcales bacterium]|nr:hypothetical protein [Magnetococcales bacterium]